MNDKTPNLIPEISVIIPIYNEEESLLKLGEEVLSVLKNLNRSYEIIFVDDGSTDHSIEIIRSLHESNPIIKYIQFRRNFGKSAALSVGFNEAKGSIIVTMDGDLQDDPSEIPKFLGKIEEGFELVCGWKYPRHDPWSKKLPSRVINFVTSTLTGTKIHDMNCGFKVYRREVTDNLRLYGEQYRFIPAIVNDMGFSIDEIKINHRPRKFGKSKYGAKRFITGFFDLLTILFLSRFLSKPLHAFGIIGLLQFFAGLGIVGYVLYLRIEYGSILSRHPLLIGGVMLVLMGMQFFSTGLIAEMMASHTNENWSKRSAVKNKIL